MMQPARLKPRKWIVSAEAAGKLLRLEVEEGTRLKAGEEIGLVDTVQLYLKKLQLEASMKSVESQRPDLAKQIAATKQQIATAEREKKRVENLLGRWSGESETVGRLGCTSQIA